MMEQRNPYEGEGISRDRGHGGSSSWRPEPPTGSPTPIPGRCGAKLRKKTTYCAKRPMAGRTRCRLHGGATPTGAALPQFKSGRYSKDVRQAIEAFHAAHYETCDFMSLRDEIALIDAKVAVSLKRITALNAAAPPDEVRDILQRLDAVINSGDRIGTRRALVALRREVRNTLSVDAQWRKLLKVFDHKRRLAVSQVKNQVLLRGLVHVEQVEAMVIELMELLKVSAHEHVKDPETIRSMFASIVEGYREILGRHLGQDSTAPSSVKIVAPGVAGRGKSRGSAVRRLLVA